MCSGGLGFGAAVAMSLDMPMSLAEMWNRKLIIKRGAADDDEAIWRSSSRKSGRTAPLPSKTHRVLRGSTLKAHTELGAGRHSELSTGSESPAHSHHVAP